MFESATLTSPDSHAASVLPPAQMTRILVVDDEEDIHTVLQYNLEQLGYEVTSALTGKEGLRLCREMVPDLVVLDLMLPDLAGTEICRLLRASPVTAHIPVIMCTARTEEIDRVVGFELGADDYVTKPFSMRELALRIRAVLRRKSGPPPANGTLEFGDLRIDRDAHRVWVGETEVELTALEFKLLVTLCERRERVQSRSVLLDNVWGMRGDSSTRTVDAHVKRLREKLAHARNHIETVRGVGYRFTARG